MIEVIAGVKGTGKTKRMLDKVAADTKKAEGNIVYVDKSNQHSLEIAPQVRLINLSEFPVNSQEAFFGFLYGMISQNSDIEEIFLDSFIKIAHIEGSLELAKAIDVLDTISQTFKVNFVVSVSVDKADLPASVASKAK